MRVIVDRQSDVLIEGRRKALFVGQRYDIPDEQAEALILSGHVRRVIDAGEAFSNVRVNSRPRNRR